MSSIADLHLTNAAAGTGNAQHFGTIGGLLEGTLMPTGPDAIILWTRYPVGIYVTTSAGCSPRWATRRIGQGECAVYDRRAHPDEYAFPVKRLRITPNTVRRGVSPLRKNRTPLDWISRITAVSLTTLRQNTSIAG